METPPSVSRGFAKSMSFGLMGLLATCLLFVAMSAAPVSRASADNFCSSVTLPPYGTYGDHCYAWEWEAHQWLAIVGIGTTNRAGCVTSAAGSGYALKESWYCIGNYSFGQKYVTPIAESRRGVIRNNNLNYSGTFSGSQACCWEPR